VIQDGKKEINIEMQNYNTEKSREDVICDVDLIWKNITIVAQGQKKGCCKKKTVEPQTILNGVNGRVKGGECLAILGSSGAGKTTLLNYLSKKIESENLKATGEVLLNNKTIDSDQFHLISSYVMQDDILQLK
jgi:ABC-type glutathione transport system ATPase component